MPGRLEVEISERALEHDFEGARRTIEALRRHGVRIALDNLGNGHLPMRELAGLDFDRLKIDGRILDGNAGEDRHVAFGLMVSAAHHLGIPVVAQGIETRDGASRAQAQGAAIGQGYLFGRPDPHTECFRLEGALARGIEDAA
jgi:EAL domain-containing protein (putative c-di-GMP-specific phosphodiesterase class I)